MLLATVVPYDIKHPYSRGNPRGEVERWVVVLARKVNIRMRKILLVEDDAYAPC